jgi:hypothetical protein
VPGAFGHEAKVDINLTTCTLLTLTFFIIIHRFLLDVVENIKNVSGSALNKQRIKPAGQICSYIQIEFPSKRYKIVDSVHFFIIHEYVMVVFHVYVQKPF